MTSSTSAFPPETVVFDSKLQAVAGFYRREADESRPSDRFEAMAHGIFDNGLKKEDRNERLQAISGDVLLEAHSLCETHLLNSHIGVEQFEFPGER